ncbi:hypothetical protein KJ785_03105 [Patescibacteria group bacterium]|nr:hypothetical protein [Patescibacteria group bacterium]
MEILDEKFEKIKKETKDYYDSLNSVFCPYLKKEVQFNKYGFEHILSKSWNRGRSRIEQYTRLRLLKKVVDVIKISYTLQEYDERKMLTKQKINSRWEKRPKIVKYYVFIAIIVSLGVRFKVVIKEVEGGLPFFWSIYPSWKKEYDNGSVKKVFYSGDLEED